jgi:hypothetical protein
MGSDGRLYVTLDGTPGLVVIDTATNEVVATGVADRDTSDAQIAIVSVPDAPPPTTVECAALMCTGDRNGDGSVTVDEIMSAVNNSLDGCPAPQN